MPSAKTDNTTMGQDTPKSPGKNLKSGLGAKKTGTGQNSIYSDLCIGTYLNGKSCDELRVGACVPYCKKCVEEGDPSIGVVQHPRFGEFFRVFQLNR